MGYPVFCQKAGCKKPGHCYSKRKRQPGLFSFWITMALIFAPCFLAKNRVPEFLKFQDPKKILGRPDKLDIRVQIDWPVCSIFYAIKISAAFFCSRLLLGKNLPRFWWASPYSTCYPASLFWIDDQAILPSSRLLYWL